MRAGALGGGPGKKAESKRKQFPFRGLVLPSRRYPAESVRGRPQAVGRQKRKLVSFIFQDVSWLTIQCFTNRIQS